MPNTITGKGNLADSPTLKHLQIKGEDRMVCNMRVFFDEFGHNEAGELEQKGGFFMSVALWGKKGEDAARHLRKGARVHVSGRLEESSFKDKDTGVEMTAFQIVADDINLALSRVEKVEFRAKRSQPEEAGVPA
jgi:single-strand DNA-binding protein